MDNSLITHLSISKYNVLHFIIIDIFRQPQKYITKIMKPISITSRNRIPKGCGKHNDEPDSTASVLLKIEFVNIYSKVSITLTFILQKWTTFTFTNLLRHYPLPKLRRIKLM